MAEIMISNSLCLCGKGSSNTTGLMVPVPRTTTEKQVAIGFILRMPQLGRIQIGRDNTTSGNLSSWAARPEVLGCDGTASVIPAPAAHRYTYMEYRTAHESAERLEGWGYTMSPVTTGWKQARFCLCRCKQPAFASHTKSYKPTQPASEEQMPYSQITLPAEPHYYQRAPIPPHARWTSLAGTYAVTDLWQCQRFYSAFYIAYVNPS